MLLEVGLTATELKPSDYATPLDVGIGLTDLAKYVAGMDAELPGNSFHAPRLSQVIEAIQPRALAFNGKKAASVFYRVATGQLSYGQQSERIGATAICVLPSTAATASGFWSIEPWCALARELAQPSR